MSLSVIQPIDADDAQASGSLVGHLQSVAKSMRQLVGIALAGTEVVVGQDQLLLCLQDNESIVVGDLAERLSVRPSTTTKMIDILERKGWVIRETHASDGRKILVRLSDEGKEAADRVRVVLDKLEVELVQALKDDGEIKQVLNDLNAILAARLARWR